VGMWQQHLCLFRCHCWLRAGLCWNRLLAFSGCGVGWFCLSQEQAATCGGSFWALSVCQYEIAPFADRRVSSEPASRCLCVALHLLLLLPAEACVQELLVCCGRLSLTHCNHGLCGTSNCKVGAVHRVWKVLHLACHCLASQV
jgi:hypothetical protein